MTGKNNFLSRRGMMAASGGALLAGAGGAGAASDTNGMPQEGPDTPKLTMYISADPTESEMKRTKQIGINWVDMPDMPPPPWTEDWFRKRMDLLAHAGAEAGHRDGALVQERRHGAGISQGRAWPAWAATR